jgi:NadR type nicotinamide-nucleotide adenylyltransferase
VPATGLVIGKFLPPHRGHQFLIDEARRAVDVLTVVVCSLAREPIPGDRRVAWIREMFPDVDVRHLTDENPQEPHEHPEFWTIWTDSLRRLIPSGPDVVLSSEDYGDELARRLGARHVLVDRDRRAVPISGRQLRDDPLTHWEHLPECVRPWFVRRVVVTGAESTGKTTLARDLAAEFGTVWVPELARDYLDRRYAGQTLSPPCREEDIPEIARGQIASEEALARASNRLLFCDTDLGVTVAYAERYFGTCPEWVRRAAAERPYRLHLLLAPDVPWVSDPQRDLPAERDAFTARLRADLERAGRAYVFVSGPWQKRRERAVAAVRTVLGEGVRPQTRPEPP